jgi:hypothetical protein
MRTPVFSLELGALTYVEIPKRQRSTSVWVVPRDPSNPTVTVKVGRKDGGSKGCVRFCICGEMKRADNDGKNITERATSKDETDEMTESELWPLQLQYPTVNDGGSTILTTKNSTFIPPPEISTFWKILAEFAEVEEWSPSLEGPPKGYKLQWKRTGGSAKASDPWIVLVDDWDTKQCEADLREFLRTKRKTTNWKLVVQVVAPAKSGGEKRDHEDDSSTESTGPSKRKKKVCIFTVIIPGQG